MGIKSSRPKIQIPEEHLLIEVGSLNLQMKKSLGLPTKMERLMKFIFEEAPPILCLQGLQDRYSMYHFANQFYSDPRHHKWNLTPSLEEFHTPGGSSLSLGASLGQSRSRSRSQQSRRDQARFQCVILSRHPVVDYFVEKIGVEEKTNYLDDVYLVCANIVVNHQMISLYTSSLTEDIPFVVVDQIRRKQLIQLRRWYHQNRTKKKNKVHLLVGALAINEISNQELNPEYVSLMNEFQMIDLYRVLNQDTGYTNNEDQRVDYQLMLLSPSEHQTIVSVIEGRESDNEKLTTQLYQKMGIYPIQMKILTDLKISSSYYLALNLMLKLDS